MLAFTFTGSTLISAVNSFQSHETGLYRTEKMSFIKLVSCKSSSKQFPADQHTTHIWGSHGGEDDNVAVLDCDAM
jgi:hypothetical protein